MYELFNNKEQPTAIKFTVVTDNYKDFEMKKRDKKVQGTLVSAWTLINNIISLIIKKDYLFIYSCKNGTILACPSLKILKPTGATNMGRFLVGILLKRFHAACRMIHGHIILHVRKCVQSVSTEQYQPVESNSVCVFVAPRPSVFLGMTMYVLFSLALAVVIP